MAFYTNQTGLMYIVECITGIKIVFATVVSNKEAGTLFTINFSRLH